MGTRHSLVLSGILTAALAACGGVESRLPDGEPGDDAPPPDAAPVGSITVTTYNRCCTDLGQLTAGVDVFAIHPDGSLGDRKTTSASGMVTLDDVPGGSVITAAYPVSDGSLDLVSVVGAQPGDSLVFGEGVHNDTGLSGTMTFTVPELIGAYAYQVMSPCGYSSYAYAPTTTATLYLYSDSGCDPGDFDLQFIAVDGSYNVIGTTFVDNATFVDGGNVSIGGWNSPTTLQARVDDLPADVDYVYAYAEATFSTGSPTYGYSGFRAGISGEPEDGQLVGSMAWAANAPGAMSMLQMYRPGDVGSKEVYETFAGNASAFTATPTPMPWLGERYISGASREIAFAKLGDEPYDGAIVQAYWYDGGGSLFGGGNSHNWTVVLPPGQTRFTWATVPVAVAGLFPTELDNVGGQVILVDLPGATGYDQLRQIDESVLVCPSCAMRGGVIEGKAGVSFGGGGKGLLRLGRERGGLRAPAR